MEDKNRMNRKVGCCVGILAILLGISTPVYGKEIELKIQGNITGIQKQIKSMETDYKYLEKEISTLLNGKAGTPKRKEQIISKGNFQFQGGKVYITASDFIYLADEIDHLESNYKCNLVEALNSIGTYFKADGSVTYDNNQNETDSEEAKVKLGFQNILQGILQSQSVESLSQTQATDKDGKLLYYAKEDKNVFELTTNNTGYPLFYQAVTADNLSAGSAAWVNGVLIKGNGRDNAIYREQGYEEGYAKGEEEGKEKGVEEGYRQGYEEGYQTGYEEGKVKGNEEGYKQGYEEGKVKGKEEGYKQGYEEGKIEGKEEGYQEGYEEGKIKGKEEGYQTGYEEGHKEGYGEGYGKGREEGYVEGHGKGKEEGYREGYEKGNENGYREGYTQGITDGLSKVNVQYIYHTHTGNDSVIGGCYGNCTGYKPIQCNCWGWVAGSYGCDNCHHAYGMHGSGYCTGIVDHEPYTYIGLVCGKTTDTIESATIIY